MADAVQKITVHTVNKKVIDLEQRLDDISYVEVGNGIKKKIPINEAVMMAWNDIEFLRDINRLHLILKKHKGAGYWTLIIIILILIGLDVKALLMPVLMNFFK